MTMALYFVQFIFLSSNLISSDLVSEILSAAYSMFTEGKTNHLKGEALSNCFTQSLCRSLLLQRVLCLGLNDRAAYTAPVRKLMSSFV